MECVGELSEVHLRAVVVSLASNVGIGKLMNEYRGDKRLFRRFAVDRTTPHTFDDFPRMGKLMHTLTNKRQRSVTSCISLSLLGFDVLT